MTRTTLDPYLPADAVTRLNPTTWNAAFRYDQAQLRPAPTQVLTVAGQGAIDADGQPLVGDMAAQLTLSLDNVERLLGLGGMDLGDVLRMTVYVTDMAEALAAYGVLTARLDAWGATPPATLLGVTALAVPTMCVEIEVTAGR